jgi:hypothetical protein
LTRFCSRDDFPSFPFIFFPFSFCFQVWWGLAGGGTLFGFLWGRSRHRFGLVCSSLFFVEIKERLGARNELFQKTMSMM